MGEPWIVREPDSSNKIIRRVGKPLNVDRGLSPEFYQERTGRAKINNLVFPITQEKKFKLSCTVCRQHCQIMTKQQLIDSYSNSDNEIARRQIQKIEEECLDGVSYAQCVECGKVQSTLETQIVPKNARSAYVCPKCANETLGQVKTLKPEKMNDIRNDPNTPLRWYWSCRCGHRYPIENYNLKIQFGPEEQKKSFVTSLESSLDRSRKKLMHKEDVEDIKAGLGGTPTSLVDSRDIEPPT